MGNRHEKKMCNEMNPSILMAFCYNVNMRVSDREGREKDLQGQMYMWMSILEITEFSRCKTWFEPELGHAKKIALLCIISHRVS